MLVFNIIIDEISLGHDHKLSCACLTNYTDNTMHLACTVNVAVDIESIKVLFPLLIQCRLDSCKHVYSSKLALLR